MRKPFTSITMIVLAVVLAAGPVLAVPSHRAECRRITRQVVHFLEVAEMADGRGDQVWLSGTLQHIDRLKQRRVRLCPEYEEPNWVRIYAKAAAEFVKKAGKVALQVFTFGAYPGI